MWAGHAWPPWPSGVGGTLQNLRGASERDWGRTEIRFTSLQFFWLALLMIEKRALFAVLSLDLDFNNKYFCQHTLLSWRDGIRSLGIHHWGFCRRKIAILLHVGMLSSKKSFDFSLQMLALYTWHFVPVEKPVPCNQSTSSSSLS